MPNVIDTLKERGLFDNWTNPELYDALNLPMTLYAGFDPSAACRDPRHTGVAFENSGPDPQPGGR